MFYPTGEKASGRMVICMDDSKSDIDEALSGCNEVCIVECLTDWLHENSCCVEKWQMKEYLKNKGISESRIDEDMASGAAVGAPAAGLSTLGTTQGMGNPVAPRNGGTNAGFYNSSLDGSGDKFSSLTVGTSSAGSKRTKKKVVSNYMDFINKRKK